MISFISGVFGLGCLWLGARGFLAAQELRKKFGSPFLHKYPLGSPASPIPDLEEIDKRADYLFRSGVKEIPGVDLNPRGQLALLEQLSNYRVGMPFPEEKTEGKRYCFNNFFFTGTDAILLYSLLRHFKPKRVVEIGSGNSSAAMLDTREAFPEIGTEFTFIEPYPDRLKSLLKEPDVGSCTIIEKKLQEIDLAIFETLEPDDFIFVDTSHQMKIGSEVLKLIFEIMPKLRPGVLIHFHDVFWPFEYPKEWLEVGRSWNESYGLRMFLQYNDSFEILFFNSYMGNNQLESMKKYKPYREGQDGKEYPGGSFHAGGSLWLRRVK